MGEGGAGFRRAGGLRRTHHRWQTIIPEAQQAELDRSGDRPLVNIVSDTARVHMTAHRQSDVG